MDFVDRLAQPARSPAGIAAAAYATAMGLALMERVLATPAETVTPQLAQDHAAAVHALRKRVADLAEADALQAGVFSAVLRDMPDQAAGARVAAYRAGRRLIDAAVQGLTLLPQALDLGTPSLIADLDAAWRLLAVGLEAALSGCEQHLKHLDPMFAESESATLTSQAFQGRELVRRADGALSWRLGRQ